MCGDDKTPSPSGSGVGTRQMGKTASPCPCADARITSQTVATSPANRARTKIGVGEEVGLTYSKGSAAWSITSGTGRISPSSGAQTTFTASDTAGDVAITATGGGCTATITFTVVIPSGWTMNRQPSTNLQHTQGRPDCGWKGIMYVHPNDVNFYNIETREKDSLCVGLNSYISFNNLWHGNYPQPDRVSSWFPIVSHSDTDGSTDNAPDRIYSGDPGAPATGNSTPFTAGSHHFPITMQWRIGTGSSHDFTIQRQEAEIFTTGRCEIRKGGNTEHRMYNDATSTY